MSDNLGAATYTPPALSVWERIEAWWFGPTVTPEGIQRDVAAVSEEERDALMPDYLKRRGVRACGARHPGRCWRERGVSVGGHPVGAPPLECPRVQ